MSLTFNYRHLYYFWVVAQEGGISRAAVRLDIAVQTVSTQVRELESALGLIVSLTAASYVLERAHRRAERRVVGARDANLGHMNRAPDGERGI